MTTAKRATKTADIDGDNEIVDPIPMATRLFLWLGVALVGGFLVWSMIGRLDITARAVGEVIPSTQVKSIQHLEGGIVQAILVREGEKVKSGQPLVELESTQSDADVRELSVRVMTLRAEIARLQSEADERDAPDFPGDFAVREPELAQQQTELFVSRRNKLKSAQGAQRELAFQREQEIKEISSRIATDRETIKFIQEQVKISESLLKDDLTNRMLHLDLLKQESNLRGRIAETLEARRRSEAALEEAQARLANIRDTYLAEVRQDMEARRRSLDEFESRLAKFQDNQKRTVLRAPVDGVIKTLYVTTIGGVVRPGGTVLDVVPGGDRLVIEARLPTQDVGYVHAGQTASVRLASGDFIRFGSLSGEVRQVSPDALQTQKGETYYQVRIETDRDYFENRKQRYQLVPGVQVVANIQTGERTVLEYLLDPFFAMSDTALRER